MKIKRRLIDFNVWKEFTQTTPFYIKDYEKINNLMYDSLLINIAEIHDTIESIVIHQIYDKEE